MTTSYNYNTYSGLHDFESIVAPPPPDGNNVTCEYCARRIPFALVSSAKLIHSYDYKGRLIWLCNDCKKEVVQY